VPINPGNAHKHLIVIEYLPRTVRCMGIYDATTLEDEDGLAGWFSRRKAPARSQVPETVTADQAMEEKIATSVESPEGKIVVATDGSSLGNPGPGGWCWYMSEKSWKSGGVQKCTNNYAELRAVAEVLEATAGDSRELEIRADSQYTIDCLTKWIYGWQKNGWKSKDKKDIKNRELIEQIWNAMRGRKVKFVKVAAHVTNGDTYNVEADARAQAVARKAKQGVVCLLGPGFTQ
jgi:ribonuclease HI